MDEVGLEIRTVFDYSSTTEWMLNIVMIWFISRLLMVVFVEWDCGSCLQWDSVL